MDVPRERLPTGGEDLPNVYHEPAGTMDGSKLVVNNTFIDFLPAEEESNRRRFSQPVFSTNSERPEVADIETLRRDHFLSCSAVDEYALTIGPAGEEEDPDDPDHDEQKDPEWGTRSSEGGGPRASVLTSVTDTSKRSSDTGSCLDSADIGGRSPRQLGGGLSPEHAGGASPYKGLLNLPTLPAPGSDLRAHMASLPSPVPSVGRRSSVSSVRSESNLDLLESAANEEGKTTIVLKNLPEVYTRATLLELLDDEGYRRRYDFVYLPIDFGSNTNFGYAFVNLVDPEAALDFMRHFRGFNGWNCTVDAPKKAEVTWSDKRQGLEAQIERYRNSPMMRNSLPEGAKPLLLKDGFPVPFPGPTKEVRNPRIRLSKRRKAQEKGLKELSAIFAEPKRKP